MIKEFQYDSLRGELIHADFQQVSLTEKSSGLSGMVAPAFCYAWRLGKKETPV
ncbi:hypothetical protein [Desulfofundulus salinus]|uniref:hypothetical protein n=1 Tax=Desulfofundulus salinus TaxID=2419843 RepID=UPI001A9BBBF1|nr:hypothetical protein [Desulfofundulus salinum]